MTPIHSDDWLTVHGGDNREVLRTLPAESVQCVITSPPYWGLRDYGVDRQLGLEATPEEYVATMVDVFREVRRVLRADGTVWINLGDSYNAGTSAPSAPSKHADVGGWTTRSGDAIGGRRVNANGLKPKDLVGIPWRVAFALQADGWYLRSDIIWAKPNPMPESVTDRPTKAHEYLFLLSKSPTYHYDADAIREAGEGARGGAPRKVHDDRAQGRHGITSALNEPWVPDGTGRNRRSVWTIATKPYAGAHFATFPETLVEPCVLAGCPEGGVVLDPFAGTGTVGKVANRLSRRAVLIDLNPAYLVQCLERNQQTPMGLSA